MQISGGARQKNSPRPRIGHGPELPGHQTWAWVQPSKSRDRHEPQLAYDTPTLSDNGHTHYVMVQAHVCMYYRLPTTQAITTCTYLPPSQTETDRQKSVVSHTKLTHKELVISSRVSGLACRPAAKGACPGEGRGGKNSPPAHYLSNMHCDSVQCSSSSLVHWRHSCLT